MTPRDFAAHRIGECNHGFRDEHHWQGWKKKWKAKIDMLPIGLRSQVWQAWNNAGLPEDEALPPPSGPENPL